MKKIIFPLLVSALVIGELSIVGIASKPVNAQEASDEFYDCEFVMEDKARLTADSEISYRGYLLRSSYEKMKTVYTDISFTTIVYPTYYISQYGKVNEETLFGSNQIYTIDPEDTTKILLPSIVSTVNYSNHNVEIVGNYNVVLYGAVDYDYCGLTLMSASLYGVKVNRFATASKNEISLISLAESSKDNLLLSDEVRNAAKDIVNQYAQNTGDVAYYVEKYVDNVLLSREKKTAKYGTEVSVSEITIDGYAFLPLSSTTKGVVLAQEKLVLKLYYLSNPKYKISYYLMDADANYVLCKQINDLSSRYYEIISLTEEQKKLPEDIVFPVPGYKDDYIFSTDDSETMGVNNGSLELKVCFKLSSRVVSFMKRSNGVYQLTKNTDNSMPYCYFMCGTFATSAVFSVMVPKDIIRGPGNANGGICFTNGDALLEAQGQRNAGDWIAMDVAVYYKGLKTSSNMDQSVMPRAAEVGDAAQCLELYYDKTDPVANPVYINDKDRELTVVLYKDAFYVYIDDVFITRFLPDVDNHFFMPQDPNTHKARFHVGDTYMFGVFMGQWATTAHKIIGINELYDDNAINEINSNPRYDNIPKE